MTFKQCKIPATLRSQTQNSIVKGWTLNAVDLIGGERDNANEFWSILFDNEGSYTFRCVFANYLLSGKSAAVRATPASLGTGGWYVRDASDFGGFSLSLGNTG